MTIYTCIYSICTVLYPYSHPYTHFEFNRPFSLLRGGLEAKKITIYMYIYMPIY